MPLPTTGGTWAQVLAPSLNPLGVRYWQIGEALVRDYLDASGNPQNLSASACGLGSLGLFSPFAQDGNFRKDLLWTAPAGNQGWYHLDELKEDSLSITMDQTVQQTPTAQSVRSVRDVLTKLDDKISITPLVVGDLVNRLRFELPLAGWTPSDGASGYGLARGLTDQLVERQLVLFGVDTDQQLMAWVFPRVVTDKKGKGEIQRKNPYSLELSYSVLPDPMTGKTMWIYESGTAFNAEGNFNFTTTPPSVTPITGLKATVVVPTPNNVTSPTYTVQTQLTAGAAFVSGTISTPAPSVSGAFTTITVGSLTASATYNALQITASGGGVTVTSPPSAPFTATAS